LYITFITSVINAFGCLFGCYLGLTNCSPPDDRKIDGFLGNTYIRNDYCVDHYNIYELLAVVYFLGYLIWDTYVCVFMLNDVTSAGAVENLFHHGLGVIGSLGNIFMGRYLPSLSTASMLTELSTPFCNMRWFLYTHKKTTGKIYIINGLCFLFSFFIARNCFQTWMVVTKLIPAFMYRDNYGSNESTGIRIVLYFLLAMYMVLCGLNFFWLHKIYSGAMK